VAHRQYDLVSLGRLGDPDRVVLAGGHRLLQQDVVAQIGHSHGRVGVHLILGRDDRRIGQSAGRGQVGPVGVDQIGRDAEFGRDGFPAVRIRLGDRDHTPRAGRDRVTRVGLTAQPGADEG
jgi:hypothetical protein